MSIKAFISYSWDSEEHKTWVLKLASDLVRHGVDVILDQWNARLGDDLAFFMEQGLTSSSLVLCVCSEQYVAKANAGKGGVGYEKRIISADMISGDNKRFILPIIKNNPSGTKSPTFLSGLFYVDFDKNDYYDNYRRLISRLYNEDTESKPELGNNPFDVSELSQQITAKLNLEENEFYNPAMSGTVSFDYKKHNGLFTIGSGEYEFVTKWSEAGADCIHCYKDCVFRIGYKAGSCDYPQLVEIVKEFDFSSRAKAIHVGEVVILENHNHRFAALKVLNIVTAERDIGHLLEFEYHIYGMREDC